MKTLRDMTEPELGELMTTTAKGIELIAARMGVEKPLFVLLLFNDPEIAQYIANCDRTDTIKALRETADRLERRETVERIEFPGQGPR